MTNQLYNFLDYRSKPEVSYDVTVYDEYKPEHLLLPIPSPFKAYNVVKPPIELNFKLFCKVSIQYIKIYGQVDSLKSTVFEISNKELGRIAYGTCDSLTQVGICFYLRDEPPNCTGLHAIKFFKNIRPVKEITLKILRTNKCPPVLKRIELWGYAARDCTVEEVQSLELFWKQVSTTIGDIRETNVCNRKKVENLQGNTDFRVPEEFLDEITWELMCIPFTLPSGKIVDESTIERHNYAEAECGRPPSDPFSGQPYNTIRKPVFNASLKARIDKFLMSHSEKLKDVPRTVGTKPASINVIRQNPLKLIDFKPGMSFEDQVQLALSSIRGNSIRRSTPMNTTCQNCKNTESLYQITSCKHFICRNCLMGCKETRIKCNPCSKFFKRNDIQKYHNISRLDGLIK